MKSHISHSQPAPIPQSSLQHLFHHILNGFRSSQEGIVNARNKGILTDGEVSELLIKNGERLIERIIEFKIVQRITCLVFATLFGYMQLTCEDMDMRRSRNGRSRRRQETEITK